MNVRAFVLTTLHKAPHSTEELAALLSLEKASRLGKTLATLETQGKIRRTGDRMGDAWALC